MSMTLILFVEDDLCIRDFAGRALTQVGYTVMAIESAEAALEWLRWQRPDLIILDIILAGDMNGLALCRLLREGGWTGTRYFSPDHKDVPVLFLTALGNTPDKLDGFDAGADDYLIKPFDPDELTVRVRAILRRTHPNGSTNHTLHLRALTIYQDRHQVYLDEQPIDLRPKEYELLLWLANHPNKLCTREELLHQVWGYNFTENTRTVDVHINRLRQQIERDHRCRNLIVTEWGVGYRLAP